METRKCRYCTGAIPADKRADTKFCSNSCKANYWEENKGKKQIPVVNAMSEKEKPKTGGQPLEGLRGIVDNQPKKDVLDIKKSSETAIQQQNPLVEIKRETQAYKAAYADMKTVETEYKHAQNIYAMCIKNLQDCNQEKQRLNNKRRKPHYVGNVDAQIFLDRQDFYSHTYYNSEKLKTVEQKINKLNNAKAELEYQIPIRKKFFEAAVIKLKSIPQYELVKPAQKLQLPINTVKPLGQLPAPKQIPQPERIQPDAFREEGRTAEPYVPSPVQIQTNSKLISSRELREMNYKCLNFQGKWKELFGLPAVVFHLAVHGKPGEGKSTFCIQFADYLAKNFGHVVYVSGEEGFSKTMQDKMVNNKIDNPYLFIADLSSCEQIKQEVEADKFHFIFIDSLDTLKMDAARLRDLREYYQQSAFVTISQSTKDGKMRGSQEIIHDTDIAVKVENGIAVTTKNRYHPRGTEFQVFEAMEPQRHASKKWSDLRNVI